MTVTAWSIRFSPTPGTSATKNIEALELVAWSNAGEKQQQRRIEGTSAENGLDSRLDCNLAARLKRQADSGSDIVDKIDAMDPGAG